MAIASILLGIASGIVGFISALLLEQGLPIALGAYVLAGISGMIVALAVGLAAFARPRDDGGMVGDISRA